MIDSKDTRTRDGSHFLKRESCSEFKRNRPRLLKRSTSPVHRVHSLSRVLSSLISFVPLDLRHRLYPSFFFPPFLHTRHSRQIHELSVPQAGTHERNMATRTFVVFQDGPSEPLTTIKTDVTSSPPSPLIEPTVSVLSPTPVTTAEKENLHPVTGSRSGTVTDPRSKKRKNTVLATKFYIPATAKKQRDSDQNGRKRKTIVTSSCKSSKGTKVATLGAPDLSKVEEVAEPEPRDQDKATQAEVDSKCYDLTVSPLADVSHAFDQVSLSPTESQPDTSRILSSKKPSLRGENGASQPLVRPLPCSKNRLF
ncbi:hypothetical protein BGW80DRAFT_228526 [Lactifluus volemus]|nr:hypothetical protein BGW80DRAFT_228526 [Lactifluus volemus]